MHWMSIVAKSEPYTQDLPCLSWVFSLSPAPLQVRNADFILANNLVVRWATVFEMWQMAPLSTSHLLLGSPTPIDWNFSTRLISSTRCDSLTEKKMAFGSLGDRWVDVVHLDDQLLRSAAPLPLRLAGNKSTQHETFPTHFFKSNLFTAMTDPWDWYICLHLS